MPLNVDTSHALRTNDELACLVEAIRDAPAHEPETDFVEWKGPWNIDDAGDRFQTARHLLGFGNRTVLAASSQFEGCAYFVAGAEPGKVVGTIVVDPARIDDQLSKYILPGQPRWTPAYVTVDGNTVLVITVEAPRQGDPIFTLQHGYGSMSAGRVFVRRHGKTEENNPADMRALEARGMAARPKVELAVTRADDGSPLRSGRFTPKRDVWLEEERDRLLRPLDDQLRGRSAASTLDIKAMATTSLVFGTHGDKPFRDEVDKYLKQAHVRWLTMGIARCISQKLAPLDLEIVNVTQRNFQAVEVLLDLPEGVLAWPSLEEFHREGETPEPPRPFGQARAATDIAAALIPAVRPPIPPNAHFKRDGGSPSVRFIPTHVRPGVTIPIPRIYLLLPSRTAGETITVNWRVTSTTADGWQEGELVYDVSPDIVDIEIPHPER